MKINMDMHIHSEYSCDSESNIHDICTAAIEKGLEYICITDHVDFNKNDYGCDYYNAEAYLEDLNQCKDEFKNEITLLSGLEFSEPHIYKKEFKALKSMGYDMTIGSIHWLGEHFIGQRKLLELNREDIQRQYFEELIEMINSSDINVVGHLDRPKIIFKEMPLISEYIDEILSSIIKRDIAIEINTRALRKGWNDLMPSKGIIRKYIEMGGNKIVVGSDAHIVEEIGAGYQEIPSINSRLISCLGIFQQDSFVRL